MKAWELLPDSLSLLTQKANFGRFNVIPQTSDGWVISTLSMDLEGEHAWSMSLQQDQSMILIEVTDSSPLLFTFLSNRGGRISVEDNKSKYFNN